MTGTPQGLQFLQHLREQSILTSHAPTAAPTPKQAALPLEGTKEGVGGLTNVVQFPKLAFDGKNVRATMIDGEPWFVAADACRCIGLSVYAGASVHLSSLAPDERQVIKYFDITQRKSLGPLFDGKSWQFTIISRPGLFKLIQRSNKPEAKQFDRWVRHEVLPQIMDNGGYVMKDADPVAVAEAMPSNKARGDLDLMAQVMGVMEAMKERMGQLEAEVALQQPAFRPPNHYRDQDQADKKTPVSCTSPL